MLYRLSYRPNDCVLLFQNNMDGPEARPCYWLSVKITSIGAITSTGSPLSSVGR